MIADRFDAVSVLFADLAGFTNLAAQISPNEIVELLSRIFSAFDDLAEHYGLEKIKTIGDCYMAAAGLPVPRPDHAEATADMALEMLKVVAHVGETQPGLNIRIGINSGPVVAGVIGNSKFIYDLWGDAVNTASRMESQGRSNEIQVSAASYELLKPKYLFEPRGEIDIEGKGVMRTYWLRGH